MQGADFFAFITSVYIFIFWPGTGMFRHAKDFLTRPEGPWNLALFRVFFFALYHYFGTSSMDWVSAVPESLRAAPPGYELLMPWIPFDLNSIHIAQKVLFISSLFAMLGCWTRASAWTAAAAGFYVFGLGNFFGKINHGYHIYFWFACLLASSRCADVLSLDAFFRALRTGSFQTPGPSQAYALPLRIMALLIGLCYFFSGFWKLGVTGTDWIFSDNLKLILQTHWLQRNFVPAFRLDQYPMLYQAAAFCVVAFELSFAALLFHPKLRLFAAASGLVFHLMIRYFLRINFLTLTLCYFVLVDWEGLIRSFKGFLVKSGVSFKAPDFLPRPVRLGLAVLGAGDFAGLPPAPPGLGGGGNKAGIPWPVLGVGGMIFLLQAAVSTARIDSWPFGIYPYFGYRASSTMTKIQVEFISARSVQKGDLASLLGGFNASRWSTLRNRVLSTQDPEEQARILEDLSRMILDRNPWAAEMDEVRFSLAYLSLKPEDWPLNPFGIKPLGSVKISDLKVSR